MKTLLAFLVICLGAFSVKAQAPYTGGSGSGYASTGLSVAVVAPSVGISLSPSPAYAGAALTLQVHGLQNKLEVRIWDPAGRLLTRERHWGVSGSLSLALTAPATVGVYLVECLIDGQSQVQKLIVLAP